MRAFLVAALLLGPATACSSGDPAATGGGSSVGGGGPSATGAGGNGGAGEGGAGITAAASTSTSTGNGGGSSSSSASSTSSTGGGGGGPCPDGITCVDTFPFSEERDTAAEGSTALNGYAPCSPGTNEGGPEIIYRVTVPSDGFLSAAVYDEAGVDIDVHILSDFDPAAPSAGACVARGDRQAAADVTAGDVWVVADTWVNGGGSALTGAFQIDIGFVGPSSGPCDMLVGTMSRVGDGGESLAMPATGPVVVEAHLVTQEEPAPYPTTSTEELLEHYALSQARTGLVMYRDQVWAPLEGGSFYGAGIGDPADFPVLDEGWYVNMYWTPSARPPRGTRMILRDPEDPARAVVVAAGYETGPGNLANIAGTTEETHYYLGTGHGSTLTLGIAQDQAMPFGPRRCTN